MKKILFALSLLAVIGCMLCLAYNMIMISDKKIVVDINKEYEEYMILIYDEQPEETLVDQIGEYVTVDFPFFVTRFSDELKCKVTYPDLQSYWIENQEELLELNEEELCSRLLKACKTVDKKTVTITFPATYDNGFLLLDSDCFEYQNALSGGLQELAVERFSELLDEMYAEVEE